VARPRRRFASALVVPCLALLAAACGLERTHAAPSITITRVPPVDPGGTSRLGTIEGRVDGATEERVAAASAEQIDVWAEQILSAATLAELLAD